MTSLAAVRLAAQQCRDCELYKLGTQTVFGTGPMLAKVMMIGEMPGDDEDRSGKPFTGPAGKMLEHILQDVGFNRKEVYLTNVVKHFRWEKRGSRRLHKKPSGRHVRACEHWLGSEIELVRPRLIVCLGATAAQHLLGSQFLLTKQHGQFFENDASLRIMATYHPSAVLRAPDSERRELLRRTITKDLRKVKKKLSIDA